MLHGIFLALVLQTIHERNKPANKILAIILSIATVMLLGRVILIRFTSEILFYVAIVVDTIIFIFGALVYWYVKRLLYRQTSDTSLSLLHFLPAAFHILFSIWYILLPKENLQAFYESGIMYGVHLFFEIFGIVLLGFYLWKSFHLYKTYTKTLKECVSTLQPARRFVAVFLWVLVVVWFFWVLSCFNSIVPFTRHPLLRYNAIWIVLSVFIYIIGYYSLRQPEIFRMVQEPLPQVAKDRLSPEAIRQLQKRLHYFMEEEALYLNPELTLQELSEKLNTTTNNLSWLLNNVYKTSFYEYINGLRVEKFIEKVHAGEHHDLTLLALAIDVGFNSKSTFNRAFKIKTGVTPSQYVKQKNIA